MNIEKLTFKALTSLQMILSQYSIDVLFLQEVDIKNGEDTPLLDGYEKLYHVNCAGVIRCITYIKNKLGTTSLLWDEDLPVVIIQLRNLTLINVYNKFSLSSYTSESIKLTKRQQLDRVSNMIKNTCRLDKRICWVGDVNIDTMNSPLANSYINFCDSKSITIENWKPTREKACSTLFIPRGPTRPIG